MRSPTVTLAMALVLLALPAGASARGVVVAQASTADEQAFREFEEIVADFSTAERVQAWEAFLQKYPKSSYLPRVRRIIAELKGEAPARTSGDTSAIVTNDPDLDFLNSAPPPTPTPAPVVRSTPPPRPTPRPTARPPPGPSVREDDSRRQASNDERWGNRSSGSARPDSLSGLGRRPPSPPPRRRGVGKASHTEIALFGAFAPDETYVRNVLVGMSATQRFGRTWGVMVEGYGASASETALLASLRNLDAEPEVITKYKFLAGVSGEANVLSAIDPVTGEIPGRNDLFLRAGGGLVNADLEICKQEGSQKCAEPLLINGVNFGYLGVGLGHRFYVTRWLALRSEVRARVVLELIDGSMTPRTNFQINLGPSFTF